MRKKLIEKIKESLVSVLPVTIIVFLLSVLLTPMPTSDLLMFMFGAFLLIVGMGFFSLGADMAMMPMGEGIGVQLTKIGAQHTKARKKSTRLTKARKIGLVVLISFLMGFIITIAEPDLQVLANQVPAINDQVLIYAVSAGVGIFLVLAILRILFRISLSKILVILYGIVIILSFFTPDNFVAVAFDSGGVTTGPITVPFIMAMGLGLAMVRSDKESKDDSFGLVAICSIGPILAVMLLGIIYNPQDASYSRPVIAAIETTQDVVREFSSYLPDYFWETVKALVPIIAVFIIFQLISRRYKKRQLAKMSVGFVYTLIGLVLFLTGVNVGFLPVGYFVGGAIAGEAYRWILVPLGMVIGYAVVAAEPAVHVLNKQVEEVSGGAISGKALQRFLSVGVAVSVGLSMVRILTGISIYWFIIPGYVIALILTRFVPKIFTGIAFDSGGVASGPMTSTFLLPLAIGASEALGGNIMTDAFGIVAMVAMMPLIVIQIMGIIYKKRMLELEETEKSESETLEDDIIVYEEE